MLVGCFFPRMICTVLDSLGALVDKRRKLMQYGEWQEDTSQIAGAAMEQRPLTVKRFRESLEVSMGWFLSLLNFREDY